MVIAPIVITRGACYCRARDTVNSKHHIRIIEANSCPSVEILLALGDDEKVKIVLRATIEYALYLSSERQTDGQIIDIP
jgi:hypothetical protein